VERVNPNPPGPLPVTVTPSPALPVPADTRLLASQVMGPSALQAAGSTFDSVEGMAAEWDRLHTALLSAVQDLRRGTIPPAAVTSPTSDAAMHFNFGFSVT
jgi:hypothetical protein